MQQKISYWVDQKDIIRKVDDCWDLTLENADAKRVTSQEIVGQSLFEFICDDVTRMYLRTLLHSIRLMPRSICRPYRCDSPDEKRYMEMTITLEENGLVCVVHELIKTEPIQKSVFFKTISPTSNTTQTHYNVRCSMCNKLKLMNSDYWQDVDTFSKSEESNQALHVIYGVCPDCMKLLNHKTKNKI